MKISHKLALVGVGIAAVVATGSFAAYAATSSHDPNVVGGRFCVDFGTNTAHYDWNNLPCNSDQYVDQLAYTIPGDDDSQVTTIVETQVTRNNHFAITTNPQTVTVNVPSGDVVQSVLSVTDVTHNYNVPFDATINNPASGSVTLTFTGTSTQIPVGDTVLVTYTLVAS